MEKGILTLCMIHTDTAVLLGMKKRGFGEGKWNGFGGKVEVGEDVVGSVCREIAEEAGLIVLPDALRKVGELQFHYPDIGKIHHVHIFSANEFAGTPTETDEMLPKWFSFDAIPFEAMWPDDRYWLLEVLKGKQVEGEFWFDDKRAIIKHVLKVY